MSNPYLIILAAAAIAVLLFTVIKLKWPAYVALLFVAILTAIFGGIPLAEIMPTVIDGMGGTLGNVALLVGLGAMLGGIIEKTGGAEIIAHRAAEILGEKRLEQSLLASSGLIAIPIFFDVAFIILVPIIFAFAKAAGHRAPIAIGMPIAVLMVFIHNTVPPHPGIVGSTTLLGEGLMGAVTIAGIILAIPMGFLVYFVGKRVTGRPEFVLDPEVGKKYAMAGAAHFSSGGARSTAVRAGQEQHATSGAHGSSGSADITSPSPGGSPGPEGEAPPIKRPSAGLVIAIILLPILMIASGTVGALIFAEGSTPADVVSFIGSPGFALLVATIAAMYLMGSMYGWRKQALSEVMDGALGPAAIVVFVTGAGGVFARVLTDTGVGEAVSSTLLGAGVPILLLAFLVALAFKVAQGSGTVATLTAAGIVQSTVLSGGYSDIQVVLIILAIGLGSVSLSHINDSGFWIATTFLGLSVADGLKTWTVLTTVLGFSAMALLGVTWVIVS